MQRRHSWKCSLTPASGTFDGRSVWGFIVMCCLDSAGRGAKEDRKGSWGERCWEVGGPGLEFSEDHHHWPVGTLLVWLLRLESRGERFGVALGERPVSFQQVWVLSLVHVPGMG